MDFFLRPAGGRLGPLAERGSVLPVGECHESLQAKCRPSSQEFPARRQQMAQMVYTVASQGMDEERRNSAASDECKNAIEASEGMRGFSDVQAKMEHKIASLIAGLQEATEGPAEVHVHMLG